MQKIIGALGLIASVSLSACTTSQMYDSVHEATRVNCNKLPDTDRSACLERNRDGYDAYKKKREAVLAGPQEK